MVSFATLILMLVTGVHPVEVIVDRNVAAVEIHLDGEVVGTLTGDPWRMEVDFGPALQPHELLAVARDARGRELSRARQMINLPRPPAEVTLSLIQGSEGRYRAARAAWSVIGKFDLEEVRALFDGSPVDVDRSGRIELPPYDPDVLHYLVVQVRFEGGHRAEAAVAVGGHYGETSQTELTSLAVELRDGHDELPAGSLDGWFQLDGRTLTVAAVDRPPAAILLVRDRSSEAHLTVLGSKVRRRDLLRVLAGTRDGLRRDDAVYLIDTAPSAEDRLGASPMWLFPVSEDLARYGSSRGVIRNLAEMRFENLGSGRPRVAQAVAAAGLRAAGLGSPRAVVLVLGPTAVDEGFPEPDNVEGYLETLQVPFRVWSVNDSAETPLARRWGGAKDISEPDGLLAAVAELRAVLDRQRIVWIKGQHLPQHIELSSAAQQYIGLAGRRFPPGAILER